MTCAGDCSDLSKSQSPSAREPSSTTHGRIVLTLRERSSASVRHALRRHAVLHRTGGLQRDQLDDAKLDSFLNDKIELFAFEHGGGKRDL